MTIERSHPHAAALDLRSNPKGLFGGFLDLAKTGSRVETVGDPRLNRRALQWLASCSAASERLERFAFDASERVIVEISQSSRFAAAAKDALAPFVHFSAVALERARKPDLATRLNRSFFLDGPRAYCELPTPHGPGRVLLPALTRIESAFQGPERSSWSEETTREAFILHEIGHVEHRRREGPGAELLGARFLPSPAGACVELLAFSLGEGADQSSLGSDPAARLASAAAFEAVCQSVLKEGYADCFSALTLGGGEAARTLAYAREWSQARSAHIHAEDALADDESSDYQHDSREALAALSDRLCAEPGSLALDPSSLHELCLACAAEGLGRWLCSVATRARPGPLTAGFYAKCALLSTHPSLGEMRDFFELVERAEQGPLGALLAPQDWASARRLELSGSEDPASDDRPVRAALSLAITLAEALGAPRERLTGSLSRASKASPASAGPCMRLIETLSARRRPHEPPRAERACP